MIAYVTSISEPTTELCKWSLERNGFDVVMLDDPNQTLAEKLEFIYWIAEDDFIRVDADVVPNRNLTPEYVEFTAHENIWWVQYRCYDWYKQDVTWGGVQFIRKEALPALQANIKRFLKFDRPETEISRIPELHNPRRFISHDIIVGLHSYAQNDIQRIQTTKLGRGRYNDYDWELADRLNAL